MNKTKYLERDLFERMVNNLDKQVLFGILFLKQLHDLVVFVINEEGSETILFKIELLLE